MMDIADDDLWRYEAWMLSNINSYRVESGVHPVAPDARLKCAAQIQLEHTMATGTQSHLFSGTTIQSRAEDCGYMSPVQENLSAWNKDMENANERMEASPVHAFIRRRANHTDIGIAFNCDVQRVLGDYAGARNYPCVLVEVYGRP